MKRVLLSVLVVGLLAGQASASLYVLDKPTAMGFTQQNSASTFNELYLVIESPGDSASSKPFNPYGLTIYGASPMQLDVGFVGQLKNVEVMKIGMDGSLPGGTTEFRAAFANDDDDTWGVRLYLNGVAYTTPSFMTLAPLSSTFLSLSFTGLGADVTEFGFEVQYQGSDPPDVFHISAVPVPGAVLLGFLGLGAAGIKLRRYV